MYSIGEISKIVKISIDALRYYDEIGLLKPCHIEQDSRYRYYSEEQVNDIVFIMEMKQYGFSLDAIKELLRCKNTDQLLAAFNTRQQQLSKEMATIEHSIKSLKRRMTEIARKDVDAMSKTVLIVDDAPFIRMILRDILEKHNYKVVGEASDGQEGVDRSLELRPDMVIMDIRMAELDGIHAAKMIKAQDDAARIIMLSAVSFLPKVLESLQAGAYDFIVKPFQAEYLLDAIAKALEEDCRYNTATITALLADNEFNARGSEKPASQKVINELLNLCLREYAADSPEITAFMNNLQ